MEKKTEADRIGLKCFIIINMWLKSNNMEFQVIVVSNFSFKKFKIKV